MSLNIFQYFSHVPSSIGKEKSICCSSHMGCIIGNDNIVLYFNTWKILFILLICSNHLREPVLIKFFISNIPQNLKNRLCIILCFLLVNCILEGEANVQQANYKALYPWHHTPTHRLVSWLKNRARGEQETGPQLWPLNCEIIFRPIKQTSGLKIIA